MSDDQGNDMTQQQAITRYEGYLRVDPGNGLLLIALGDLYHHAGRFNEAMTCYEKCLAQDPAHVTAKSRSANVMISQHRFADAEKLFRELTASPPPDPALLHNLGITLYHQERWDDALTAFKQAHEMGLQDSQNVLYHAYSLHRRGDLPGATALCREWLEAHPDASLNGYLAVLEMDSGDMAAASQRAMGVLQRDPGNADAALVASMWRIEQQDIDAAREHVNTVLKTEPESARGWFAKGLIHMYLGEHDQAIAAIENAVKRMPNHVGTITTLGWARFAAKDIAGAERTFRQAIAVDGSFGEAHGGLSITLVFQNRREEARREMHIARRLDPQSLGAVWTRGSLMALDGKREAGEALVAQALDRPLTNDGKTAIQHIQHFFRQQAARSAKPGKHLH